jgi:hypothetical protein
VELPGDEEFVSAVTSASRTSLTRLTASPVDGKQIKKTSKIFFSSYQSNLKYYF